MTKGNLTGGLHRKEPFFMHLRETERKELEPTVKELVSEAVKGPKEEERCLEYLIHLARRCGFCKIIKVLAEHGIHQPDHNPLCLKFIIELCVASS